MRTLHHYDEIGLLKPGRNSDNGYRVYSQQHLMLLQQIMLYRNLDLSLDTIKDIVTSNDFDLLAALKSQRKLLLKRQQETQIIINSIEVTMNIIEGKQNLDILFTGLPTEKVEQWQELMSDSYGDEACSHMLSDLAKLSEEESRFAQQQFAQWINAYRAQLASPVDSDAIQALIRAHYILQNRFLGKMFKDKAFQGIGYNGYLLITDRVLTDPVANSMYEHYQAGMAEHLHEAMMYFAKNTLKATAEQIKQSGLNN